MSELAEFIRLAGPVLRPDGDGASARRLQERVAREHRTRLCALRLRLSSLGPRPETRILDSIEGLGTSQRRKVLLDPAFSQWLLWAGRRADAGTGALLSAVRALGTRRPRGGTARGLLARMAERVLPGSMEGLAEKGEALGARRRLARALGLLRRVWPEQRRQTDRFIREVVVVGRGGFEGTLPEILGAVFYRSGTSWFDGKVGPARGARAWSGEPEMEDYEFVLHESAHQQLIHLGRAFPLWDPGTRPRVSPWTGRERPPAALSAALHAYWITYSGFQRVLRHRGCSAAEAVWIEKRSEALLRGFAAGFGVVRATHRLTPYGDWFLDRLDGMVRRREPA